MTWGSPPSQEGKAGRCQHSSEWPQWMVRTQGAIKACKPDTWCPLCLAEATHQEQWTRELAAWRAVAGEHDRMMRSWRKAWESCDKDTF